MAKEVVISAESINSWGTRVITSGIDISQYVKNPILLFMHKRDYTIDYLPIGTIENLRFEGTNLIGTPVFDEEDPFAVKIKNKWEKGILRMVSAGVEPKEYSTAAEYILPGQTRATVIKSKLIETSIADIGSNDDTIQLYNSTGRLLTLSKNGECDFIPLLSLPKTDNQNKDKMNKEFLLLLGLPDTATEEQAMSAVRDLQTKANKADTLELSHITAIVDGAISDRKILAEKRDHFITLGKAAGVNALTETLNLMHPASKPNDLIHPGSGSPAAGEYKKLSEVPEKELKLMRNNDFATYSKLYEAEFGAVPVIEK